MAGKTTGWRRLVKATGYSWQGLRAAWEHEAAFRQETVVAVLAAIIACCLDINLVTRLMLIGSVVLVIIVEIINSAIEAVVDRFGGEQHALSGRAKDMGSAAVLLAILLALVVWGSVLWSLQ
ncbi:diacylglycerol kinase [Tatumella saanichensis]|uniref:diacylglycerol kinase n=1 Tax=Tatumella saanichensis TaxID=480813 RepID=UPI0004A37642|nr:diacylglycerol kinase [Tatumella saanichensis]